MIQQLQDQMVSTSMCIYFYVYTQQNLKAGPQRDIYALMFRAALFTIAKRWKQPKCPTDEKISKMWCIHTTEYTLKRKQIMTYAKTGLNLKDIMLSAVNQP